MNAMMKVIGGSPYLSLFVYIGCNGNCVAAIRAPVVVNGLWKLWRGHSWRATVARGVCVTLINARICGTKNQFQLICCTIFGLADMFLLFIHCSCRCSYCCCCCLRLTSAARHEFQFVAIPLEMPLLYFPSYLHTHTSTLSFCLCVWISLNVGYDEEAMDEMRRLVSFLHATRLVKSI